MFDCTLVMTFNQWMHTWQGCFLQL